MYDRTDEFLKVTVQTEQHWRDGAAAIDRQLRRIEELERQVLELRGIVDELATTLFRIIDS